MPVDPPPSIDPLQPVDPCATPHHPVHRPVHRIVGRIRRHGTAHHLAHRHLADSGCGKLPAGSPGALPVALLPRLIPAITALAAGAALLTAAANLRTAPFDPGTPVTLPAWPPNDPGGPGGPGVPISEPETSALFAAAALLVIVTRPRRRQPAPC